MNTKHPLIIALSGHPGAGKSTTRRLLADALNLEEFYAGLIFKEMAKEKGMETGEFYAQLGEQGSETDREVDRRQAEFMRDAQREGRNVIVEGRMAPFLAKEVPKVTIFLRVDPRVGAERQKQREENQHLSVDEIVKHTKERVRTERKRYKDIYGIEDHLDTELFDIVIDTTNLRPEEVALELTRRTMMKRWSETRQREKTSSHETFTMDDIF